jgi:phosphate transport system protein
MACSTGDPAEGHTAKVFDHALAELRLRVVSMGGLAIDQVSSAIRALLEGNIELSQRVLGREAQLNEYERDIDSEALRLVALHQPVAGDLRLARAISRIIVELERAGDEAKKIARFAGRIAGGEPAGPVAVVSRYLRHMADLSVSMLRDAIRALDEFDVNLARGVSNRDSELDAEFAAALRLLMTVAMEDQRYLSATIETVFALKGLERIGDHAKNIAEQVVFTLSGEDVRHRESRAQ